LEARAQTRQDFVVDGPGIVGDLDGGLVRPDQLDEIAIAYAFALWAVGLAEA